MWWIKKKERNKEYDYSNRDKHHAFYNTGEWRRTRLYILSLEPLCSACLAQVPEVLSPSTVVDHIQSLTDRWDLRLTESNLTGLCKPHHDRKSRGEQLEYIKRKRDEKINDRMNELENFHQMCETDNGQDDFHKPNDDVSNL